LDTLWDAGTMTRHELRLNVDLAKSTVKDITDDLIRDGLVDEVGTAGPRRRQGRPPRFLKISTERGHLIAVDIGAEKVIVRVTALSGDTIAQREHHFGTASPGRAEVFRTLRELTDQARLTARTDSVLAVAIGTPGVVSPHDGSVTLAPQIDGWNGLRLDQEVATMMSVPRELVVVERQADLAAVAEWRDGAAKGAASVHYVHLGVGLGSAILLDGRLYRGRGGAAGEIGYLPHNFDEEIPPDSGMGSWEWAAGGLAFARHGRAAAKGKQGRMLRELAGGDPDAVDARVVFAADAAGDPAAAEIVDRLTERLAIGIASGICVLAPDRVILAGGISRAGERLLHALERSLRGLVPVMPELRVSRFGDEGVVTGAVFRAAQHALDMIGAE
jgi:glucokinase